MKIGRCGKLRKNSPPKRGEKAALTMEKDVITKVQIFAGVYNAQLLIAALRRKDQSYIRGALQWLIRKPPNPHIVNFLRAAYFHFRSGSLSL